MFSHRHTVRHGFTSIELAIASVVSTIVTLAVAVLLVDAQRSWSSMYNRTYADVIIDGHIATRTFDALMRKAQGERVLLGDDGSWVEVNYYAGEDSIAIDRYARLYKNGGSLDVEHGQLSPKATLTSRTICQNVTGCTFKQAGRSIQMILALNDGTQLNTVISSAFMHN